MAYILTKVSKLVREVSAVINKFMTSVGYLSARENEVELLTTKFYNLRTIKPWFHAKIKLF